MHPTSAPHASAPPPPLARLDHSRSRRRTQALSPQIVPGEHRTPCIGTTICRHSGWRLNLRQGTDLVFST